MSIWTRISEALEALRAGEPLSAIFDRLRSPPEQSVGFTIAVLALGAKMAKADGEVSRVEVTAFREVFAIPPGEEANAARVFNLSRQDVAGFEEYARRIARMFGAGHPILSDLLEGLFHIALADGSYHPAENEFLARVAEIFGIAERAFRGIRARFVPGEVPDPWSVLGVEPEAGLPAARRAWAQLVRDNHPDRLAARGLPAEAVRLAEKRLIAVNAAWEEVSGKTSAGRAEQGAGARGG